LFRTTKTQGKHVGVYRDIQKLVWKDIFETAEAQYTKEHMEECARTGVSAHRSGNIFPDSRGAGVYRRVH
jgi:hypothetical protein